MILKLLGTRTLNGTKLIVLFQLSLQCSSAGWDESAINPDTHYIHVHVRVPVPVLHVYYHFRFRDQFCQTMT